MPDETGSRRRSSLRVEHDLEGDEPNLTGDYGNVLLLLFFYILQGIPLGLAGSVPLVLSQKGATYTQQGLFSLNAWPFSMKLLWAPIVDAFYSKRFGRRKSWLIPSQFIIGLTMIASADKVDSWLGYNGERIEVENLLVVFFFLNFLAATQDIAVDGWALTILQRKNVGYASVCNSVGESIGYYLGYVFFLALESADFCNYYLRKIPEPKGMISCGGFLHFWGIVFLITTTAVLLFKTEAQDGEEHSGEHNLISICGTYKFMLKTLRQQYFMKLCVALFTAKIGVATVDAVSLLHLVEDGVPKEKMAVFALCMMPIQLFLPLTIATYSAGPRPMNIYLRAYPFRLFMGLILAAVVWVTPSWKNPVTLTFPTSYYILSGILVAIHQGSIDAMYVAQMAFFNRISDPKLGGTYMTLLNTVANLGTDWPHTLVLYTVDYIGINMCTAKGGFMCLTVSQKEACKRNHGKCVTLLDGYFVGVIITTIIGILWLIYFQRRIDELQKLSRKAWVVNYENPDSPDAQPQPS